MTNPTIGGGRRRARLALLSLSTILAAGFAASPAAAQIATQDGYPVHQTVDADGVDLSTGQVTIPLAAISIGDPANGGISYQRSQVENAAFDGLIGSIQVSGSTYTVTTDSGSEQFLKSGTLFTSVENTGATLTQSGDYVYVRSDGTRFTFDPAQVSGLANAANFGQPEAALTQVVLPNGATYDYTYRNQLIRWGLTGTGKPRNEHLRRLQSITSNAGYQAQFFYAVDTLSETEDMQLNDPAMQDWKTLTSVTLFNTQVDTCDVNADSCSFTRDWPSLSLAAGSITDNAGRTISMTTNVDGTLATVRRPGSGSDDMTVTYSGGKVSQVVLDGVTTTYGYTVSGGTLTATRTTGGDTESYVFDADSLLTGYTNGAGKTAAYQYTNGVLTRSTAPEGDYVVYTRDARGNVTQTDRHPKTGSGDPVLTTSATFDTVCATVPKCNEPNSTTDALGYVTDYSYDATTGDLLGVTGPAPSGSGTRPQTRYSYTATAGLRQLTGVSSCAVGAAPACVGTADERRTVIGYGTVAANNLLPVSATQEAGDGSVTATSAMAYDADGNLTSVDGPLAGTGDTVTYRYDDVRQRVGAIAPDPDGAGARARAAVRTSYDAAGRVTATELGTVAGTSDADWSAFASAQGVTTSYASNRKTLEMLSAGGTPYAKTQYSYDSKGRLQCAAVRMNPSLWGTLPGSACTLQTAGSAGPDRVTKTTYDAADRPTLVQSAYGTADQADEAAGTYSDNGKLATLSDANGNLTTYEYDSYDRLAKTRYPDTTLGAGTSSATDYEQWVYDANGNVTSLRLRGYAADSSKHVDYSYDHLNRLTLKNLPGSEPDVSYGYDLLGEPTGASTSAQTLTFSYDALGRLLTQAGPEGTLAMQYDAAGERTRLTWPDAFYVAYDYDSAGNLLHERENGAASGTGVLATYAYDDLGNRTSLTRGNGTSTSYTPDALSRLHVLSHDLASTASDVTTTLSYNPASQIASNVRTNDAYAFGGYADAAKGYTVNGLNQATAAGGVSVGYDARGNTTAIGSNSYTYSSENLLLTGPSSASLIYDPLDRLYQTSNATLAATKFQYDGLDMVGEYDASDVLQKRYVHGPATDEPLVEYDNSGGTFTRSWLYADERGSVVATADDTGAKTAILSYDEYGVPATGNTGRFGYTGQAWLPELAMWYYKARMYAPSLGRFMQTDPIGYGDGMNWYNYTNSDPINLIDPTGTMRQVIHWCVRTPEHDDTDGTIVITAKVCRDVVIDTGGGPVIGGYGGRNGDNKPKPCFGPPKGPPGITSKDLSAQSKSNAKVAEDHSDYVEGAIFTFEWFHNQLQTGGNYDYKKYDKAFEPFGNYNYGVMGAAAGIPADVLLRAAGRNQEQNSAYKPEYGQYWGDPPYGDDPRDQEQIKKGISDYNKGCYK